MFDGVRSCVWTSGMRSLDRGHVRGPCRLSFVGPQRRLFSIVWFCWEGAHDRCLRRRPGRAGCCKGKQRGLWLLGVSTRRVRVGDDDLIDDAQI